MTKKTKLTGISFKIWQDAVLGTRVEIHYRRPVVLEVKVNASIEEAREFARALLDAIDKGDY